jgi:peptide/nickel transport system substrate-binding protein
MRRTLTTPSVPLAVTVAACLSASACVGGSRGVTGSQGRYAENGTFTMSIGDDLGGFDPYQSNIIKSYYMLAYDSMINIRLDGTLVSGLADKWSADARSATFRLRPDVTCSDGTPLTAGQVAADLTYAADPKNKSSLYGSQVPSTPFTATGDDATRTVKIAMSKPYGFLLHTVGLFPVVCGKGMKDRSILKTSSDGTGPFVLTKVVPGQSYTFTVRKGYKWGPAGATTGAPGTPRTVVLRTVTNETTAANLLLSGQISAANIAGDDQQRLVARGMRKVPQAATGAWLWFNHAPRRPTADTRLRQALVDALDIPALIKVNAGGYGGPSTGLAGLEPKACPGDTVRGRLPAHDTAAADTLLNQAGWIKGPDGIRTKNGRQLTLDLHFVAALSSFNKPTAELVAEQWKTVGIKVKLTADTIVGMNTTMFQTANFDVYMQGYGVFLPSAMVKYIAGPVPPEGVNLAAIDNKDYEKLTDKAISMTPPSACTYWNQAEQALWRAADIVPIANRPINFFLRNAEAQFMGYENPVPTSIRMLAG